MRRELFIDDMDNHLYIGMCKVAPTISHRKRIEESHWPRTLHRWGGGGGRSRGDNQEVEAIVPNYVEPKDDIGDGCDVPTNEGFSRRPSNVTLMTMYVDHVSFQLWQVDV